MFVILFALLEILLINALKGENFASHNYYYGSGSDDYDFKVPVLPMPCTFDYDCSSRDNPYCCLLDHGDRRCCNQAPTTRKACEGTLGKTTGVICPPWYDSEKSMCCNRGLRCCYKTASFDRVMPPRTGNEHSKNGGNSVGAMTAIIFISVIVVGTLATFATRYFKIKLRREQRRAGTETTAYIDAINRRTNEQARNNHQEQSETIQDTNGIRATNNITAQPNSTDEQPISETNISLEDEELGSPPTYAEALSCEVVRDDVQALSYGHSRIENFSYSPPRRPKQWHPYKNGQTVANKDSSIQETAAITYVTTSDIGDAM